MTEIERKRKELDLFIAARDFNLSDKEVIEKAAAFERDMKKADC